MSQGNKSKSKETSAVNLKGIQQYVFEKISDTLAQIPKPHELEQKIEDGVQKTLELLNIPTREEVNALNQRLDELIQRCDDILEEHSETSADEQANLEEDQEEQISEASGT